LRLQSKILFFLVPLTMLPLLVLGWSAYTLLMEDARSRTQNQATTLLEQVEHHTETRLQTARANASLFASNKLIKRYVTEDLPADEKAELKAEVMELLFNYQLAYPEYYEIRIISPDGKELVRSVIGEVGNLTEDESSSLYFQGIRNSPGVIYTTFFMNPDNGKPALLASKPLLFYDENRMGTADGSNLYGYLMMTINPDFLDEIASTEKIGESGEVFFTDASGVILYHRSGSSIGRQLPSHLFDQLGNAANSNITIDAMQGDNQVHYQATKLHDQLYAFAVYGEDEFHNHRVDLGRSVTLITCTAILALIVFLMGMLRRLLINPIRQLSLAASEMGRRQVLVPINVRSDDEIGDLAKTFRQMGMNLAHYNEQVHYIAYHDSLTGLPNRLMFRDYLKRAIAEAKRSRQELALLFLDLDNFKRINDTLGHQSGDKLLQNFADRINGCLRETDVVSHITRGSSSSIIARLAGDEFIILLPRTTGVTQTNKIAKRILDALSEQFIVDKQELFISTSIGIALFPDDGQTVDDLMKNVDIAMYHAKKSGRNNFQYFSSKMNEASLFKLKIEGKLRHAVENGELILHYQPQVDMATGRISGAESLLRWSDPELGQVSPEVFIPIAEEYGLIIPISEWLVHETCRQGKQWLDKYNQPITMAINISAVHLNGHGLEELIANALESSSYDPQYLEMELTESSILSDPDQAISTLINIQGMGLQTSLDDFGTGYSSLNYLMRLPLNKLKIDRSFIQNLEKDSRSVAIVSAIIAMAHNLNLEVVAEGVELESHIRLLRKMKCDILQGYHIARPMPASDFEQLFINSRKLIA
jgi:diguanylate cyclase (GGDEF)-like protein